MEKVNGESQWRKWVEREGERGILVEESKESGKESGSNGVLPSQILISD